MCLLCGVGAEDIARGLGSFGGARRRMEFKGTVNGADVFDDYGHHPTEIRCTLSGARSLASARGGRLFCVYQPHTYSRTKSFWKDFVHAFRRPYKAGVLPIYAAREDAVSGVSSDLLAREAGIAFLPDYPCAASFLEEAAKEGCTLLLAGAGSVEGVLSHLFLSRNEDSRC